MIKHRSKGIFSIREIVIMSPRTGISASRLTNSFMEISIRIRGRQGLRVRVKINNLSEWCYHRTLIRTSQELKDTVRSLVEKANQCKSTGNIELKPAVTDAEGPVIGQGSVVLTADKMEPPYLHNTYEEFGRSQNPYPIIIEGAYRHHRRGVEHRHVPV